ncbi:hypothetical protein [Aquabacter sediminis]|uniref:hypothetical protein n=1 Tax=Aquabacter sediminis TaxID=3029197 RepID=UPI00237EC9A1|nr:hypothetical protein [Aquabacter sp. P-9]MDE1567702.1 hypothetical protein [Aquabacter sp. P-9]
MIQAPFGGVEAKMSAPQSIVILAAQWVPNYVRHPSLRVDLKAFSGLLRAIVAFSGRRAGRLFIFTAFSLPAI